MIINKVSCFVYLYLVILLLLSKILLGPKLLFYNLTIPAGPTIYLYIYQDLCCLLGVIFIIFYRRFLLRYYDYLIGFLYVGIMASP